MDWNPLRSFVTQALKSTLEKYITNVDFEALGVTGGAMVLRDLELRKEAFPVKNGLRLDRGFVKELRVSIPWTQLLSAPVHVEIRTCEVVLVQDDSVVTEEAPSQKPPSIQKKSIEQRLKRKKSTASTSSQQEEERGWLADTLRTITANATIDVSNLVFKFERNDVVATLSLKSMNVFTCDSQTWEKKFQKPLDPFGALFKAIEVGGLTINVESLAKAPRVPPSPSTVEDSLYSPRRPTATFEVPVLKRTDARVRICIHLNPGVREAGAHLNPSSGKDEAPSSVTSLPSLLLQGVSSVVSASSVPVRSSSAFVSSKTPNLAEEVAQRRLSASQDPFQSVISDPFNHPNVQFTAAVDIWIERLAFSVSERQIEMLETLVAPRATQSVEPHIEMVAPSSPRMQRELLNIEEETAMTEDGDDDAYAESDVPATSSGWTSWAWNVVGGGQQEPDESDQFLSNLWKKEDSTSSSRSPSSSSQIFNVSVVGCRIDRASLSLVLHSKTTPDGPASATGGKTDDRSSQTSQNPPSNKKVIPVKTPIGIVYVDADDEDGEEEKKRKSRKASNRLITFAEIIVRGVVIQSYKLTSITGHQKSSSTNLMDVQSIEATRWHDVFVDRISGRDDDEQERRDVFLTWQVTPSSFSTSSSDSIRSILSHPHQEWSLWAHPPISPVPPAIRIKSCAEIASARMEDGTDEKYFTVDVALAPLKVMIDALLIEGLVRFVPPSTFVKLDTVPRAPAAAGVSSASQKRGSSSTDGSAAPKVIRETLVTMQNGEIQLISGSESIAAEWKSIKMSALNELLDVDLQLLDVIVRPGSTVTKKVFRLGDLSVRDANPKSKIGSLQLGRVSIMLSPFLCRSALSVCLGTFDPLNRMRDMPLNHLAGMIAGVGSDFVLDQTALDLTLVGIVFGRSLGAATSSAEEAVANSNSWFRLSTAVLSSIGGHTMTVFRSRSASSAFLEFNVVEKEVIELKVAGWELEFEGIVRSVLWLSRFSIPSSTKTKSLGSSSSKPSSAAAESHTNTTLNSSLYFPAISIDIEPGDVLLVSSKPNTTSEFRTPLVTVRSRAKDKMVSWTLQGLRFVTNGQAILPHAKATGRFQVEENGMQRLDVSIWPVLVDVSLEQIKSLAELNVNKLQKAMRSLPTRPAKKSFERELAMSSEGDLMKKAPKRASNLDLEFHLEALQVTLNTESGMSESNPARDVPQKLFMRLDGFKIEMEQRISSMDMFVTLRNLRVNEESPLNAVQWPLLSFLPSGDAAVKVEIHRQDLAEQIAIFSAVFDASLRLPAWRACLALVSPFALVASSNERPNRSPQMQSTTSAKTKRSIELQLDIGAGSSLNVPISSTLDDQKDRVEAIVYRFRKGIYWEMPRTPSTATSPTEGGETNRRPLGGILEIGRGEFVRSPDSNLSPAFVLEEIWSTCEPQIVSSLSSNHHTREWEIRIPMTLIIRQKEDLVRLRKALLVVSSKSLLERRLIQQQQQQQQRLENKEEEQVELTPSRNVVADLTEEEEEEEHQQQDVLSSDSTRSIPKLRVSIPEIVVQVFNSVHHDEKALFEFQLINLQAETHSIVDSFSPRVHFDSVMLTSSLDGQNSRVILSSKAFSMEHGLVELSKGEVIIMIEPIVISTLLQAFMGPPLFPVSAEASTVEGSGAGIAVASSITTTTITTRKRVSSAKQPTDLLHLLGDLKILLPRSTLVLTSKSSGPAVVFRLAEGFASLKKERIFDATFVDLEVLLPTCFENVSQLDSLKVSMQWLKALPKTNLRIFGEFATRSVTIDCAKVKLAVGLDTVAVLGSVTQSFRESLKDLLASSRKKQQPQQDKEQPPPAVDAQSAIFAGMNQMESVSLASSFHMLLDKRMDPSEGQLVFSDQPTVDGVLLGEESDVKSKNGGDLVVSLPAIGKSKQSARNRSTEWIGFRFKFHEQKIVTDLVLMNAVLLDIGLSDLALQIDDLDCELLVWDSIRQRWLVMAEMCVPVHVGQSTKSLLGKNIESTGDFSDAFNAWVAEEIHQSGREDGDNNNKSKEGRAHQVDFPHEIDLRSSAATNSDLYWIRWRLPPLRHKLSDAQKLAVSNSLMQTIVLHVAQSEKPLIDLTIQGSFLSVSLLHQCGPSNNENESIQSELMVARFPTVQLRSVVRKDMSVLLATDATLRLEVNKVADFTKSTILPDARFTLQIAVTPPRNISVECRMGNFLFDLHPESLLVASHALRGFMLDVGPDGKRLQSRVKELLYPFNAAADKSVIKPVLLSASCSCTRMVFVNASGTDMVFGKSPLESSERVEAIYLRNGETAAYSWSSCMCESIKRVTSSNAVGRRLIRFALASSSSSSSATSSKEGNGVLWTEPVDVERIGVSKRRLRSAESGLSSSLHFGKEDVCDLFVGVQLGEPTIQTVVVLHASDAISNYSYHDLELCPIGSDETLTSSVVVPRLNPSSTSAKATSSTLSLLPNVSLRTMVGSKRRGGWVMRTKGATGWSRIVVPNYSANGPAPPVLVEVPSVHSSSVYVWCSFKQFTEEEDVSIVTAGKNNSSNNRQQQQQPSRSGQALWNVMEIRASYVVENNTDTSIRVRIRPEHRWESLQYALQSVSLSTTPPGPRGDPVGKWLPLVPPTAMTPVVSQENVNKKSVSSSSMSRQQQQQHRTRHHQHQGRRDSDLDSIDEAHVVSLNDEEDDDDGASEDHHLLPSSAKSMNRRHPDVGAQLAQDLLRSVSPPPAPFRMRASPPPASPSAAVMSSPATLMRTSSPNFVMRKSFSASLEQSSLLADDASIDMEIGPKNSVALDVDPRECHALLLRLGAKDDFSPPLRLHPAMVKASNSDTTKSTDRWSRRIEVAPGMNLVAVAHSGEPTARIDLSAPYRLRNSTDRLLLYVPVEGMDGTWLEGARPVKINPGQEHSLYWGYPEDVQNSDEQVQKLGVAFASLPWDGAEPDNLFTLDWSAPVQLDSDGHSLVPIPLSRAYREEMANDENGFFCGWVLQTVVTVRNGRVDLTSRARLRNGTGFKLKIGLRPPHTLGESFVLSAPDDEKIQVSVPSFLSPKEDGTLALSSLVEFHHFEESNIVPPSVFVEFPVGLEQQQQQQASARNISAAATTIGCQSFLLPRQPNPNESNFAADLIRCEFVWDGQDASDLGRSFVANLFKESQPRFILRNACEHSTLEMIMLKSASEFDRKLRRKKRQSVPMLRVPPCSQIPLEMDCLSRLFLDDQRNVFVLPCGPFSSIVSSSGSSASSSSSAATASASGGRVEKFFAQFGQSDEHVVFRIKDNDNTSNGEVESEKEVAAIKSSSSSVEIVPFGNTKQAQPTRPNSTSPRSGGSRSSTLSALLLSSENDDEMNSFSKPIPFREGTATIPDSTKEVDETKMNGNKRRVKCFIEEGVIVMSIYESGSSTLEADEIKQVVEETESKNEDDLSAMEDTSTVLTSSSSSSLMEFHLFIDSLAVRFSGSEREFGGGLLDNEVDIDEDKKLSNSSGDAGVKRKKKKNSNAELMLGAMMGMKSTIRFSSTSKSQQQQQQQASRSNLLKLKSDRVELQMSCKSLQIESLVDKCEFPLVLTFDQLQDPRTTTNVDINEKNDDEDDDAYVEVDPVLSISTAARLRRGKKQPPIFEDIDVFISPMIVNIEDETIRTWARVLAPTAASMVADWGLDNKRIRSSVHDESDNEFDSPKSVSSRAIIRHPMFFVCQSLSISTISIMLTLKTATSFFLGMDRTPIRLWPVAVQQVRCTSSYLQSELGANYLADVLLSSPALLGSLEILGNPTGLVRSFARGVYDLVAIPLNEIKRGFGPGRVVRGIARGWLGLLRNVADGTLTSVSGFSASLARNLHLTIDHKRQEQRRKRQVLSTTSMSHVDEEESEDPSSTSASSSSSPSMSSSSGSGMSLKSVLRGIAGVVVKPAESAADLVAHATKGIIVSARLRPPMIRIDRNRLVGFASGFQGLDDLQNEVDVDRMLAWKVFHQAGPHNSLPPQVIRSSRVIWENLEASLEIGLERIPIRMVLTSEGICALNLCQLHSSALDDVDDNAHFLPIPMLFSYRWKDILSVEESLIKVNLIVLVVNCEDSGEHKQVRFTLDDASQRRAFVLDILAGRKDFKGST